MIKRAQFNWSCKGYQVRIDTVQETVRYVHCARVTVEGMNTDDDFANTCDLATLNDLCKELMELYATKMSAKDLSCICTILHLTLMLTETANET